MKRYYFERCDAQTIYADSEEEAREHLGPIDNEKWELVNVEDLDT